MTTVMHYVAFLYKNYQNILFEKYIVMTNEFI